ncbi:MAG: ABC transporter permease subunit [Patescibacteria group bacterium]|nr:ABC transporter permease subunit [Patescibacteria group bacterium]
MTSPTLTIAKKEYRDSARNALFITLAGFMVLLTAVSILVASFSFQAEVAQYNAALSQLTATQRAGAVIPAPSYYPLLMLRGTIEYLEIIGAVLAIVLGYLAIAKEKGSNTSRLLLTRPVSRAALIGGKVLGTSLLILTLLALLEGFIILSITAIGHVAFSSPELLKLTLSFSYTYFYLLFFFCFSAALTLFFKDLPRALLLSFALWLVFVLIIPQIGDTMDPDNQVPGGFFASMHTTQDQQHAIIAQFQNYENFRNALEVSSIEKHYERLVFATLGIKGMYNDKSLGYIMGDKWPDLALLLAFYIAGVGAAFLFASNKRIMASSP